jgi:hypothetical protein
MFKSFKLHLEQLSDRVVPSVTEPTSLSEPDASMTETVVASSVQFVDSSSLNDVSELLASTLEQNPIESEFDQLLLREFQVALDRFVKDTVAPYSYSSSSSSAGQGDFGGDPNADPFLADNKKPLTEKELKELEKLVKEKMPNRIQEARRDELMERMKVAGIAFDGTNELEIIKQIAARAPRGQGPLLKAGINKAISGLQNIDEQRYQLYKSIRNSDPKITHDEAWTFLNGGDIAKRRYELEKIAEQLKDK